MEFYAFYMEWQNGSVNSLKANLDKIDVLIPERLTLQRTGIEELHPYNMARTLAYVRDNNTDTKILSLINNYNKETGKRDDAIVAQFLQNPQTSKKIIAQLRDYVDDHELDGVTLHFRNLTGSTWQLVVPFAEELNKQLKAADDDYMLTMTVPFAQEGIPYQSLAEHVDKLIVMAYGEHGLLTQP